MAFDHARSRLWTIPCPVVIEPTSTPQADAAMAEDPGVVVEVGRLHDENDASQRPRESPIQLDAGVEIWPAVERIMRVM